MTAGKAAFSRDIKSNRKCKKGQIVMVKASIAGKKIVDAKEEEVPRTSI